MFGRKLLLGEHVNAMKQIQVDGSLLLTCKNCRALQECKLPATKELPFLWAPTSKTKTKDFPWPFNGDIPAISQATNSKHSCHNTKNGRRERYKTLKAMFSENQTNYSIGEDHKRHASIQTLPLQNVSCKGLQSIIDSQRLIQEELAKSQRDFNATENKEKRGILSDNDAKHKTTVVGRKQKNIKTLHFSKNKHVRLSKERQFQMPKKVPGAQELAMERIAANLIEEWPLLFESKVTLDTSYIDDSIYFDNNLLRIKTRGARLYKLQIVLFKWASKIVWMDPTLQMLQVTKHTQDNTIKIRWLTNGKPRLLYPLMFFGRTPSLRYMDFFSTLKVGENEKIEVHRLSKAKGSMRCYHIERKDLETASTSLASQCPKTPSGCKLVPRQNIQKRNPIMSLLALLGLSGTSLPRLQEEPVLPSSSESGH